MGNQRWMWRVFVVVVLCLCTRPVFCSEAGSLVDVLKARGQDASFEARRALFKARWPGEAYLGNADQNFRLLKSIRTGRRPGSRTASDRAPLADARVDPGIETQRAGGWTVEIDRSTQVLSLDCPPDERWESVLGTSEAGLGRRTTEPILQAVPPFAADGAFISAALLGLKAKLFDDGLYAAVELAADRGVGAFPGRLVWMRRVWAVLERRIEKGKPVTQGMVVLAAALLRARQIMQFPAAIGPRIEKLRLAFDRSPIRSKPLGFYTWDAPLRLIFQRDRILQEQLLQPDVAPLVSALAHDGKAKASYLATRALAARLTNAFSARDLLTPESPGANDVRLLPPSRSYEVDLARRLWPSGRIPDGARLMDELIKRVRAGKLSLAPRPDSGWYDRQTYALEPLLRPDAMEEAPRLALSKRYGAHLEQLFRGMLALTRETHIKQLESCVAGACIPPPQIRVGTGLTLEPLPTHYARRADAYRFVRRVLVKAFGISGLRSLHRRLPDGEARLDLASELDYMETLFRGAAETSRAELHLPVVRSRAGQVGRLLFRVWASNLPGDPDLSRDTRMMVPVAHDPLRGTTRVWALLGWADRPLTISFRTPPRTTLRRTSPEAGEEPRIVPMGQSVRIAYPIVRELDVHKLLDRKQFRALCDESKTLSAMLRTLRAR